MHAKNTCFIDGRPTHVDTENGICDGCRGKAVIELGGGDGKHQHPGLRELPGYMNVDRVEYDDRTRPVDFDAPLPPNPFGAGKADFIFTSHCLEHVTKLKELLNACHAVLVPGGIMEVVVPHKDSDKAHAIDHVRFFARETFKSLEYRDIADYGFLPWKILYLEGEKDSAGNLEIRCRMTPANV